MDIFNRKKLAEAEEKYTEAEKKILSAELRINQLNEKLYETERTYKQKLIDAHDRIEELESKTDENNKSKNYIYYIRNTVIKNREYISAVYCSKLSFFTPNEYKLYILLRSIIQTIQKEKFIELSLFSHVRLADIVRMWEEYYYNQNKSDKSFFHCKEKNRNKTEIVKIIQECAPDFNEDDYKETFLYPLLSYHIDFLICLDKNDEFKSIPICAIELNGSEHYKNFRRQKSDKLKESLFEGSKISLLSLDNDDLKDNKSAEAIIIGKIYEALQKCNK